MVLCLAIITLEIAYETLPWWYGWSSAWSFEELCTVCLEQITMQRHL